MVKELCSLHCCHEKKNSQGATSANPKMQITSLWVQLVVLLLSICNYLLCQCPAPSLRRSFLAAASFVNQLGQPLLVFPHQEQKFGLLVEFAVPFNGLGLTLLLYFKKQKFFGRDGQNSRLYQFLQYVWDTLSLTICDGSIMVLSVC